MSRCSVQVGAAIDYNCAPERPEAAMILHPIPLAMLLSLLAVSGCATTPAQKQADIPGAAAGVADTGCATGSRVECAATTAAPPANPALHVVSGEDIQLTGQQGELGVALRQLLPILH
jgi:hypothetical protein